MPLRPKTRYPWAFEVCQDCGRNNVAGFRVTDKMWLRVTGKTNGVLCINCFDDRAYKRGIDWTEEPIEFYTVSSVGNDKWQAVEDVTPQHTIERLEAEVAELKARLGEG